MDPKDALRLVIGLSIIMGATALLLRMMA